MTDDVADSISRRKLEHLELALNGDVEGPDGAWWEDVRLLHNCLPEVNVDEIRLDTPFLGQTLAAPLWIAGMTGGHERAAAINARLARAAERYGLAMGLGSQRAALAAESLAPTYAAAREAAPNAVLIANIGAPQLVAQEGKASMALGNLERLVESIGAQGLAIHLNFLQEAVQPEGDLNARGCLDAIAAVARSLSVPVMVKETGGGMDRHAVLRLRDTGVAAIDVGGAGGTSFVRVEGARAAQLGNERAGVAATFDGWGIPTAASVLEARGLGVPIIATGGVRSGLDAARAIALGAHAVGVGRPFLLAANRGQEELDAAISGFLTELRTAFFLTGSGDAIALRSRGALITGRLREWAMGRELLPPTTRHNSHEQTS